MNHGIPGIGVKPRRWRRRIFRCLLGAIALTGLLILVRHLLTESCWSGFCERQRALAASIASRPSPRIPIPDDPVPGEAWDQYREAALILGIVPQKRRSIVARCLRPRPGPKGSPRIAVPLETADPILSECAAGLDRLRAGARRESATHTRMGDAFPTDWLRDFAVDLLTISFLQEMAADRIDSAMGELAVLMQFKRDVGGRADAYDGFAIRLMEKGTLNTEHLERLDRMFERAETQVPSLAYELEDDRAVLGMTAGEGGRFYHENSGASHHTTPWWLGWSIRLEIARGDIEFRDQIAIAPELEKLSWKEALLRFRDADPSYRRFQTIYARWRYEALRNTDAFVRRTRARCRLVRAATMALRGLDATSPGWPLDPFDLKPIRLRASESEILVWSPDADGDQGGEVFTNDRYWAKLPSDLVLKVMRTPR